MSPGVTGLCLRGKRVRTVGETRRSREIERARRRCRKTKPKTRLDEVRRLWRHPIDGCCSKWEDYQQTQSATKAHLSVQTKRPSDGRAGPAGCQHPRPPVFAGEVCQSWRSPDGDKRNMQQVYQFSRPSSYQQSAIEKPILQERSNAKCNSAPHPMFLDVGQRSFTSPLHLHAYAQNITVEVLWVSPNRTQGPNPVPFSAQGPHGRTDQAASSWEQRAHREPVEALSLVYGEHVMAQDQKKVDDQSYHLPVCCVHA